MKKILYTLITTITLCTALNTVIKADVTTATRIDKAKITSIYCTNGNSVINFTTADGNIWQYSGNFYLESNTSTVTLYFDTKGTADVTDDVILDWWEE